MLCRSRSRATGNGKKGATARFRGLRQKRDRPETRSGDRRVFVQPIRLLVCVRRAGRQPPRVGAGTGGRTNRWHIALWRDGGRSGGKSHFGEDTAAFASAERCIATANCEPPLMGVILCRCVPPTYRQCPPYCTGDIPVAADPSIVIWRGSMWHRCKIDVCT